jgi:NAD(P)-dependent dehydrogenase (short-subunit alcohol dehydrogenase family)
MKKKVWFITGISSGLGKALAEELIANGDFVIGTFRQQSQAEAFNHVHANNAYALKLDLMVPNDIQQAYNIVQEKFGRVDVLVNNAGVGFAGAIEETSMHETRNIFEANFFGTLELTRTFLPLLRSQKQGHIFQISSHAGVKAFAGFGIYNATKFALEGFSEALALELAPLGIKVTIVEPGPFRTQFANTSFQFAKQVIADYASTAGVFRERIKLVDGKQEGDPIKAARTIIQIAEAEKSTLRLPLGKVALASLQDKVSSLQNDLMVNKALAENAVF